MSERDAILAFLRAKAAKIEQNAEHKDRDCARVGVASAVTPLMRARVKELSELADIIERGDHLAALPRTQETVLRAMLAAHEAEALKITIAYFRAADDSTEERALCKASERADGALADLRDATAAAIVGDDPEPVLKMWGFFPDYAARLAGTRPLDAPPLED